MNKLISYYVESTKNANRVMAVLTWAAVAVAIPMSVALMVATFLK